ARGATAVVGTTPPSAGVLPPPRTGTPPGRQRLALGLVLVLLAILAGRLVHMQVVAGPALAAEHSALRLYTQEIPGERGRILDRNGVALATSVERWNVVVNQAQLVEALGTPEEVAAEAARLGPVLGVPAAELGADLWGGEEKRQFVYLAKGVVPEVYDQVRELRIPGITGERATDRTYPAGNTAGNLVGFVGAEGFGQAGIEQVYDEVLAGTPGQLTYEQGARGQRIPGREQESIPAVPGRDVQLTIDRDVQFMAQRALDAKVAETGAEWGAVQVVDVRTGEILALVDSGAVDPNDPGATPARDRGSRSIEAVYEPGSTAKVISMAAVLETGAATPASRYTVPYQYTTPNGQTFKDSNEHPTLQLTLAGVFAESSNTGTIMAGEALPEQVRHDYLRKFGFGEPTGVGLPGESGGILWPADTWDGRSKYAVLFGQAVSSTVLQNTQVFATIANGGVRVQPHLVEGTTGPDGRLVPAELEEPERVISPETAATMMQMLETAVVEGTGGNGAVPGYRVGGKTGTAQAFEGGGVIKYVASFIGVAPVDDPRIAVNVVLYSPKTEIYGGVVAAPVFRDVTSFTLQHLGVPPTGTTPELLPTTWE
ncbi:cell division protein FtsI, partial [Actinotalea ferrariae CF5-4]